MHDAAGRHDRHAARRRRRLPDRDDADPRRHRRRSARFFLGDTPSPRVSVGIGVNWNSPFGPFRIDIAKALLKAGGRRHQTLHLQRRNCILMKTKLDFGAAVAALACHPAAAIGPAASGRRRSPSSTPTASAANAPRASPRPAAAPGAGHAAPAARSSSSASRSRPRRRRSSRPRSTRCRRARAARRGAPASAIQAFRPASRRPQQELAGAAADHPVAPSVTSFAADRPSGWTRSINQVMRARGANIAARRRRHARAHAGARRHRRRARRCSTSSSPSASASRRCRSSRAAQPQPQQPRPQGR